ncbi:MAG: oligosaccharide flippase family protein [Conexivisphaerales archaeon]|jgi:O-antigen/teichoic acid export membrane protein
MEDETEEGRSTARGLYNLFLGNFTSTLLLAVCAIAVGRILGPSDYGLYSVALILPGYVYLAIQLGIPSAATRFSAKYAAEGDRKKGVSFIQSLLIFQLLLSLLSLAVIIPLDSLIAVSVLNRADVAGLLPVAVISVVGNAVYYTGTAGFQGLARMDRSAMLQVFQALIKLVASVALILVGFGVFGALVGNTLSLMVSGVAGLLLIMALGGRPSPKEMWGDIRVALGYSAPLYLAATVSGLLSPYSSTLLANFVSNAQIGGYGAAINISALVTLFVFPIATALLPIFSGLGEDRAKQIDVYQTTARFSALVIVPVTMLIITLSTPLTAALYGRAYGFAGIFLVGAVAPNLYAGLGSVVQGPFLAGTGQTRKYMNAVIIASVLALISATVLTPVIGVFGVIAANILAQTVSLALCMRAIRGALGRSLPSGNLWKIYPASAGACLAAFAVSLLPLHPIILTLFGGVVFILVLVPLLALTRTVNSQEVASLATYFSSVRPLSWLFTVIVMYYELFSKA